MMSDTYYNLLGAGVFNETDLLDFVDWQRNKGRTVQGILISRKQASHLTASAGGLSPKKTGKKLVDYWDIPDYSVEAIHGIKIKVWDEES